MKNFLREKSMLDYISSAKTKPIDTKVDDYATILEVRKVDNFKIIT